MVTHLETLKGKRLDWDRNKNQSINQTGNHVHDGNEDRNEDYDLLPDENPEFMSSSSDNDKVKPKHLFQKYHIVWRNVILFAYLHLAAFYGVYLMFTSAKILTSLFGMFGFLFVESS